MVHSPGLLHISFWDGMARRPIPSSYYYMSVKHLEGNSQQCNCLSDYWLSILTCPPLSPHLWLFLLVPEPTDASSPLPCLNSSPEDLLSRQTQDSSQPSFRVFCILHMYPNRQIHFIDRQWHIWILRGETNGEAYCIDLHLFFHVEGDIVKTSVGFHTTAMSWWL